MVELRVLEQPALGDEGDVHVRALTHVARLVHEHAVVQSRFLCLHLHEDVGQVVVLLVMA